MSKRKKQQGDVNDTEFATDLGLSKKARKKAAREQKRKD